MKKSDIVYLGTLGATSFATGCASQQVSELIMDKINENNGGIYDNNHNVSYWLTKMGINTVLVGTSAMASQCIADSMATLAKVIFKEI